MKTRIVEFSDDARKDLIALYDWISEKASPDTALSYIERLEAYCSGFDVASERGHTRFDIREGLRIVGFEKRVTIAFMVTDDSVIILRLFYGGQNWSEILSED